jgi:cholesterol transport system auxiliary component
MLVNPNRWRTGAVMATSQIVCLSLVCLISGCISRHHLSTRTFGFDVPPASKVVPGFRSHRIVTIRSLRVAAPFDGRSMVYRKGEYSFESDPHAEFLVSSSESLLVPIRRALREAGTFDIVVEPGSAMKPNTVAEISVPALYGDFRRPEEAYAILRLRILLFDSPKGVPEKLILEREYSRHILLKARNPEALMAGWDEALRQILAEFDSDVRALEPARDLSRAHGLSCFLSAQAQPGVAEGDALTSIEFSNVQRTAPHLLDPRRTQVAGTLELAANKGPLAWNMIRKSLPRESMPITL